MRKKTSVLASMLLISQIVLAGTYSGGTGAPDDPYQIGTAEDLNDISNHIEDFNKCFVLTADIDLSTRTYSTAVIAPDINEANWAFDGTAFTGVFDGNDHRIIGLTIDTSGGNADFLGLFGDIGPGAEVKNLGLENVTVAAGDDSWYVGGLVGWKGGIISNCYSTGTVTGGRYLGGLAGDNDGSISNCYSTGVVAGYVAVGGLVGRNYGIISISDCYSTGVVAGYVDVGGLVGLNYGTISDCHSTGSITGGEHSGSLGGLVGDNYGSISTCYSTGSVTGGYQSDRLGGLVGDNYGSISTCYSTGSVTGGESSDSLGGLVGDNYKGTVSNCYSIAAVTGGDDSWRVGGLVGINDNGKITNCYSTGAVTGGDDSSCLGGLVGYNRGLRGTISNCYSTGSVTGGDNSDWLGGLVGMGHGRVFDSFWDIQTSGQSTSDGGEGKTTAEMQRESTFTDAGWDFIEIWDIGENQTYPFLRQYPAGDINHDDKVNFLDVAIIASHWLEDNAP